MRTRENSMRLVYTQLKLVKIPSKPVQTSLDIVRTMYKLVKMVESNRKRNKLKIMLKLIRIFSDSFIVVGDPKNFLQDLLKLYADTSRLY